MQWSTSAPSNIALIKYMGKENNSNDPTNSSLSYTLEHLRTYVTLEIHTGEDDIWHPLRHCEELNHPRHCEERSDVAISIYEAPKNLNAQTRYLNFFKKLKQLHNIKDTFIIRSANNFPANCGLASSASSFAALTKCALQSFADLTHHPIDTVENQAKLSQIGSGSSCRSFFSPWCIWTKNSVNAADVSYHDLIHLVVVVNQNEKRISSSEAHQRVCTSDLFPARAQRAEKRLAQLLSALQQSNWKKAYVIAWQEFWDMHALFETSAQPFHYMTANSLDVLNFARHYWEERKDGPIITMDAGPNVHLLFRPDQKTEAINFQRQFEKTYLLLTNMNSLACK